MNEEEEAARIQKLAREGWEDEEVVLVRLTDEEIESMGNEMFLTLREDMGRDTYLVMEVTDHAVRLPDGIIVIEARGRLGR